MHISEHPLTHAISLYLSTHNDWVIRRNLVANTRRLINRTSDLNDSLGWLIANGIIVERTVKTGGRYRREYCHKVHWNNMSEYTRKSYDNPVRDVLLVKGDWVAKTQLLYRTRLTASEINVAIARMLEKDEVEVKVTRTGGKPLTEYRLKKIHLDDYTDPPDPDLLLDSDIALQKWGILLESDEPRSVEEYDEWVERQKAPKQEQPVVTDELIEQLRARYDTKDD